MEVRYIADYLWFNTVVLPWSLVHKLMNNPFSLCGGIDRALWHCEEMIQRYSREMGVNSALCLAGTALPYTSHSNVGKAVEDCMRAIIGVLLNLTHDNGEACAHTHLNIETHTLHGSQSIIWTQNEQMVPMPLWWSYMIMVIEDISIPTPSWALGSTRLSFTEVR